MIQGDGGITLSNIKTYYKAQYEIIKIATKSSVLSFNIEIFNKRKSFLKENTFIIYFPIPKKKRIRVIKINTVFTD